MTVKVCVIMGSDSDWPVMEGAVDALKSLGIGVEATVVSAHRTPQTGLWNLQKRHVIAVLT